MEGANIIQIVGFCMTTIASIVFASMMRSEYVAHAIPTRSITAVWLVTSFMALGYLIQLEIAFLAERSAFMAEYGVGVVVVLYLMVILSFGWTVIPPKTNNSSSSSPYERETKLVAAAAAVCSAVFLAFQWLGRDT